MISVPSGARVWLVAGYTDMHKAFDGLALLVQKTLKRHPHNVVAAGSRCCGTTPRHVSCAKRLERGRLIWPSKADGTIAVTAGIARISAGRDRLAYDRNTRGGHKRRLMRHDNSSLALMRSELAPRI
jgi:transposase